MRIAVWILLWFVSVETLVAQQYTIRGKVEDANKKNVLPFVNIIYGEKKGVITSLDGNFSFAVSQNDFPLRMRFSYVGYRDTVINLKNPGNYNLIVKMHKTSFVLKEVTVKPTENPANRIIKKVVENRKKNDPEKSLESFYYKSYNKMYFSAVKKERIKVSGDTLFYIDTINKPDTSKAAKFIKKQHLFLLETVSERYYERPDKSYEKILASRVSGFTIPTFFVLATQFQSFSFYKPQINLLDNKYISPVSAAGWKKYFFQIIDTSFTGNNDTVFIIKFKPHRGTKINGLKGVLYITTDGFAIKNVMAEPQEQGDFFIKINQNYKKVKGHWMPLELNSKMIFNTVLLDSSYVLDGVGKTYLFDIYINGKPDSLKPKFGQLEVDKKAFKNSEEKISGLRVVPLTKKDSLTYHIIDSLGKAEHLDLKYRFIKYVLQGAIPIGPVNLKVDKLLIYNLYEKLRLGVGLETNDMVSRVFEIGGYYAYSFGIKKHNYGGNLKVFIDRPSGIYLSGGYANDVIEAGGYDFYGYRPSFSSSEGYRLFYLKNMDEVISKYGEFNFRNRHLSGKVFFDNSLHTNSLSKSEFSVNEAGVKLKYAIGEKVMKTLDGPVELGTKYPVLFFNYSKGISINARDKTFDKYEFMIRKDFDMGVYGIFRTTITGGMLKGDVPLSLLYDMRGSNYNDHVFVGNTFQTMNLCSFYADRFVTGHFYYDLKHLILKIKKFSPNFVFAYNAGWGTMSAGNIKNQALYKFDIPDKLYQEGGLVINDILVGNFAGYGVGVFYKFGAYASDDFSKNFVWKLSFILHLD